MHYDKRGRAKFSVQIGSGEQNIADWFNMLKEIECSRSRIVSAILVAYDRGEVFEVGKPKTPLQNPSNRSQMPFSGSTGPREPSSSLIYFGFGEKGYSVEQPSAARQWGYRGPNREFIVGSNVSLTISNPIALMACKRIEESKESISEVVKYFLGVSWKKFPNSIEPNRDAIDGYLTVKTKKELIATTNEENRNISDKNKSNTKPHRPLKALSEAAPEVAKTVEFILKEPPADPPENDSEPPPKQRNPLLDLI